MELHDLDLALCGHKLLLVRVDPNYSYYVFKIPSNHNFSLTVSLQVTASGSWVNFQTSATNDTMPTLNT